MPLLQNAGEDEALDRTVQPKAIRMSGRIFFRQIRARGMATWANRCGVGVDLVARVRRNLRQFDVVSLFNLRFYGDLIGHQFRSDSVLMSCPIKTPISASAVYSFP